jgi:hypothetical protein
LPFLRPDGGTLTCAFTSPGPLDSPNYVERRIQDGIDAGAFRPVDPRLAALGIIGMINWIAWWYRPDRDGTGESVAANLADMAVDSVLHERQASLSGDGATAAIAALRQNLDYLEQHVNASRETRT